MTDRPEFLFSAVDWLLSRKVREMSPAQRGMYIMLLANAWDSEEPGTLPDDDEKLWWMAGCRSKEEWLKDGSTTVRRCFRKAGKGGSAVVEGASGWLVNDRLFGEVKRQEEEAKNRVDWSAKSSRGGVLSGISRRCGTEGWLEGSFKGGDDLVRTGSISLSKKDNEGQFPKESKGEGVRGRGRKGISESCVVAFEKFWTAYPNKVKKQKAFEAFFKATPDGSLVPEMLEAIRQFKLTSQWIKNEGEFIPHPTTWLNQHRWEDEIPKPNSNGRRDAVLRPGSPEYNAMIDREAENGFKDPEDR